MNANKRMKYASTPTYGMQKRGFSKAQAAAQGPAGPDFTQLPMPEIPTMPMSQPAMPFAPTGAFPAMSGGLQPGSFFPSPMPSMGGMPPMGNPISPMMTPALGGPINAQSLSFGQPSFLQATPTAMHPGPQMPLSSSPGFPQPQQPGGFSPRQQGYMPQLSPAAPTISQGSVMAPGLGRPVDSMPGPYPPMNPSMQGGYGHSGMGQPPSPYLNPMGAQPVMQGAMGAPSVPMNGFAQQGAPQQMTYAPPKAPRAPMDAGRIMNYFLFGALPLLFIPCLFVPSSWDFLRYAFIAVCVIGIGMMWYRQMFTPNTRTTVTIIYAALCIVTISMLLSGARDAQTTSTSGDLGQNAQASFTPDPMAAGAVTSPPPEDTPAPISAPGESEAENRLDMFMGLWNINKVEDMCSLVKPSWASQQDFAANALFMILANRTPLEYNIEGISGTDADSSRTITMSALIDKNNNKDKVRYRFMVLMVKEGGEWYIDPDSLATNDVVVEDPSITPDPNATPTIGLATPAPRTTVTPVPDPGTKLYYNPDGGIYYHADPECPSVKEKFRPLQGTFPYSDLAAMKKEKNLQPCLKCNAPVNPLPQAE